MLYTLLDILSPVVTDIRALEDALIEARLAYTDSCGNTVLCQGTLELLASNPNYLKKQILKYIDKPDYSPLKKNTTMTEEIPQNANTVIIVKGDYVQNKHVDYQIGDIASGGVGVQIAAPQTEKATEQAAAEKSLPVTSFIWPTYTNKASLEDNQTFETQLKALCKSKKRSLTSDIKAYLNVWERNGLLIRPVETSDEWSVLVKFGYPYHVRAYHNRIG